jgi:superfamily II DNA/RNA helicase
MPTKFFTNQGGNSLLKKFEGVFANMESIRHFDALVGYFRTSGYFKVRPFLGNIPKIRILVGINVDQLIKKYHDRGQMFLQNANQTKDELLTEIIRDIQAADYDETTEKGIVQFLQDLTDGKIELRAHPSKKIHAKVYIFRSASFNEYAPCEVITGSSNLTDAGLGAHPESNYEFNVSLRDYEDVKFATDEFERLWDESVPILHAEADAIRRKTYLRDDFTPFELYIRMLIAYFGKRVEYDPYNIDLMLPDKYKRLKYQSDAANQGYAIMMKHNGFILADVVGLGKTIIACMVMKKFIYENGTHTKILVVVPPALESSWQRTANDFQIRNHFYIITIGSLQKILHEDNHEYPNPGEYDLIVVDESHKFRNDYTNMYKQLQDICKHPRSRPAENGDNRKKVILISATPLNNRPQDIENQLYLFQDKRNSTLDGVRNLQDYFKPINELYRKLAADKELNVNRLKMLFRRLRDDVIEPLVIRRTRTDIENNPEYLEDLKAQNITFPKVDDPIALFYELDPPTAALFNHTISMITGMEEDGAQPNSLGYYRYRAIEFLTNPEDREIYGNVESIASRLSSIMRVLLVKRLESSFYAFKQSLSRLQKAIDNMIGMFEEGRVFIAPDLDINKLLEEGLSYDEIEAKINEKGGNNKEFNSRDFDPTFIDHLRADKAKVDALIEQWSCVERDTKLEAFSEKISTEFFGDETRNPENKLVIFSESKETAALLSEHLQQHFPYRVLTISADNRKANESVIRENFDANLEPEKQRNDYNIIITTEVLAEGINLHRSNLIVNYDVPWNATRLMQRIGRVNRIGSKAEQIFVYNFYPSAHGDAQIRLVNNALRKLQAFHTAFGEDNKIFSIMEEKGDGALFGSKIIREESEILNYLNELRAFKKSNPKRFAEIANIPAKARCGRKTPEGQQLTIAQTDSGDNINYPLRKTSVAYLKSDNHPGIFCLVTPDNRAIDLTFLQAAAILKAAESEKPVPLHEKHYEQAIAALAHFKSEKNQAQMQQPASRQQLSPAENRAISNIRALLTYAPTEQKKSALQQACDLIMNGTYGSKSLPKAINDFMDKSKHLTNIQQRIEQLFVQVLDSYDLTTHAAPAEATTGAQGIINPTIVLTQSFA